MCTVDPTLVPLSDLPLQTILYFTPCPSPVVESYLGCLALAEGYSVQPDDLVKLCQSSKHKFYSIDLSEELVRSSMTCTLPVFDLRKVINDLQVACQISEDPKESCTQSLQLPGRRDSDARSLSEADSCNVENIRRLSRFSDTLSYADCCITRRESAALEVSFWYLFLLQ